MAPQSDGGQQDRPPGKGKKKNKKNFQKRFEGSEPSLKGFIFDYVGERNPEQWNRTKDELKTYVGRTYKKYTGDFLKAMDELTLTNPTEPPEPEDRADVIAGFRWKSEFAKFNDKIDHYNDFRTGLFSVVMGQCSASMKDRVKSHQDYPQVNQSQDGVQLLSIIEKVLHTFEARQKIDVALDEIEEAYYLLKQGKDTPLQKFHETFKGQVQVMEDVGITFANQALVDAIAKANGRASNPSNADREEAKQRAIATRFLRACNSKHQGYRTHLSDSYLDGSDYYPKTAHDAYNIMQRREDARLQNPRSEDDDGLAFTQDGEGVALTTHGEPDAQQKPAKDSCQLSPDINGRTFAGVKCYQCQGMGHYASSCPKKEDADGANSCPKKEEDTDGANMCITGFSFSQPRLPIPKTWILLDSQSTVDLFCNEGLLTNIRESNTDMNIHCNAGVRKINKIGDLPGYGPVWYDPQAIANILSLRNVKTKYSVVYDSNKDGSFTVTKPCGKTFKFEESDSGLFYLDTRKDDSKGNVETVLVNTVANNRSNYTDADYSRAVTARQMLIKIGRPNIRDFENVIRQNAIPNCPVTIRDIRMAEDIFGPDIGSLKGKTTRRKPHRIRTDFIQLLPASVMQHYRRVTICGDLMHVNGVMMLITVSRNIKFHTVSIVNNKRTSTLLNQFKQINKVYRRAGFECEAALLDGAFEPLRDGLGELGITLNTTSRDEHVGEAERAIRTIKERMRAIHNTLPFKKLPTRLLIEMAKSCVFWINALPQRNGVSKQLSPRTIITGMSIDYRRHCQYEFGEYVQTHEEHDNTMAPRTIGALALRPTGNAQGGYYFYNLSSGRIVNRNRATKVPMPGDVIERVELLADRHNAMPGLAFGDQHRQPGPEIQEDVADDISNGTEMIEFEVENEVVDGIAQDQDDPDEDYQGALNRNMDDRYGRRTGVYNLRARKEPNFGPRYAMVTTSDQRQSTGVRSPKPVRSTGVQHTSAVRSPAEETESTETEPGTLVTAQMGLKQGLKKFQEAGMAAVKKEIAQLHYRRVMRPRKRSELTRQERRRALGYLMFLKRKRNGKVKARGCADGRPQREYTRREDATSPTVANESVFITAVIDGAENREVAVVDVPGAFMQAEMDELVHVRLTGVIVDVLMEIDPSYQQFMCIERGVKVIYVELLKALYGTLRAARLFWMKLTEHLESWGFEPNPYDPCVANKLVNGKQLTVAWHVDDLKISHQDVEVVDAFIEDMRATFGTETPLSESRGKVHDYLGMTLDYSTPGKVIISMVDYVKGMIDGMAPDMSGRAPTPAASHLFQTRDNAVPLEHGRKEIFVHLVMQGLYLSQRARPDIRTAISFLCSRIKCPDEDDYLKLRRLMQYLQGTVDLVLVLDGSDIGKVQWWVDASYAVHDDTKGHTGGTMSMGGGSVYSTSTKQKLVSRSSTESEVIGVYDVMPQVIWTSEFLRAQGYEIEQAVLYQDNMSAMLLEKNGRASSSKRTKHMNIRYFYIKDMIDRGEISIEHCPTELMLADYFTKPLQGRLFYRLRDQIMNVDPNSEYHSDHRSVLKSDDVKTSDQPTDERRRHWRNLVEACEPPIGDTDTDPRSGRQK
eukprot:Nitzschia sp. Nitz4//scaffold353_size16344//11151//16190//NITZ4_008865-RA/size16344-processed-gene-0.13-mRNA-1//1//CDS//3329548925//8977//frame0